jgi:hypothetical protein
MHGPRHSYVELALSSGVPLDVVSRAIGRAIAAFTADHYAHDSDEEAAELVARAIERKREVVMSEFEDAYDEGARQAQDFIDRHSHGYPAVVMGQNVDLSEPEDEIERERARGWYERLGRRSGRGEPERELKAEDAGV